MLLYEDQGIVSGGNWVERQPGYHADATTSPTYDAFTGGPSTARGIGGAGGVRENDSPEEAQILYKMGSRDR
jgi:hypothetical protein